MGWVGVVVVWDGTMAGVVLSQEGVGYALPSSNMLDDLAFGWCGGGVGVGLA